MKSVSKVIIQYLGSRIARNIYLWIVILYIVLNNDDRNRVYNDEVYLYGALATSFIIALLTYFNNLVLVPRLLAEKRVGLYFLSATVTLCFFSVVYILVIKLILNHYPDVHVHQISLISTPVTMDWSIPAITDEVTTFLFGLFCWMFIITMAWFMNDYARQKKMAEDAKKKQVETELYFLKNQVNPHFLFNTMNNLYALALKKSDKGPDAILRLSSILRYLLYESNVEKVQFEKEKEIMHAYIDLELLRLPENSNFNFIIESDGNHAIPPLLWLPLLENIFKHGTGVIADTYFIDYKFVISNGMLKISSKNNYKSTLSIDKDKAGGIGLDNLRKRLALLYPNKHTLSLNKDDNYCTVNLEISLS